MDLGAGFLVDSRATHAIDKFNAPTENPSIPGKWRLSRIKYYSQGVDVDKEGLPYRDSMFDLVVSFGGFGWNFGNIRSAKEIKRVLKAKGSIELGVNKENLDYTLRLLKRTGFRNVNIFPSDGGKFYKITAE